MGRTWKGVALVGAALGAGVAVMAFHASSLGRQAPQANRPQPADVASLQKIDMASGGTLFRSIARHDVSAKLTGSKPGGGGKDREAVCDEPEHGCGVAPPPEAEGDDEGREQESAPAEEQKPVIGAATAAIEQRVEGKRDAARMVESFDGLGYGFQ